MRLFLVLIFILAGTAVRAADLAGDDLAATETLKAFYSDGCTGFVDGPPGKPKLWYHCCYEHDLRYWFGGIEANMDFTDLQLKACVKDVAGGGWADIVYNGVRAGHHSPVKSKMHWGWGWTPDRPNTKLTPDEIVFVEGELRKLPLDPAYVDRFIEKYLTPLQTP